ncbi:hypothetical protein EYR38_002229 [Pleurotus pulmonarius]|nr:hypothetical protein EYR38_002229 [Pleurotus pulmonarius]
MSDPVDNHTQPDNSDHVADTPEAAKQHNEGVELEEEEQQPEHMYCSAFFYVGKDRSRRENLVSMASPFHLVSFNGAANIYPGYAVVPALTPIPLLTTPLTPIMNFVLNTIPTTTILRTVTSACMEGLPYIRHDTDGDAMDTGDSTLCNDTPTPESGSAGDPGSNTPTDMEQEDTISHAAGCFNI